MKQLLEKIVQTHKGHRSTQAIVKCDEITFGVIKEELEGYITKEFGTTVFGAKTESADRMFKNTETIEATSILFRGVTIHFLTNGELFDTPGQQENDNQSTGSKSRLPQVDVNNAPAFIERFTEGDQAWTIINNRPTKVEIISISNKPGEDEVEIELDYARKHVKIDTLFPTKEKLIESILIK